MARVRPAPHPPPLRGPRWSRRRGRTPLPPSRATPSVAPGCLKQHLNGPEQLRSTAAAVPSAGTTKASNQGHNDGGGHAARAPPPPPPHGPRTARLEGPPPPLTQWRTRHRRRRHPSPHCRRGGSTAGPAQKRPSSLRLVPPGRRAGTGGGPVGEDTGASTRLGPPPCPCASVHRPVDVDRQMPCLCVFHPFWGLGWGGVSQGICTQPTSAFFHPGQLKYQSFGNFFLVL